MINDEHSNKQEIVIEHTCRQCGCRFTLEIKINVYVLVVYTKSSKLSNDCLSHKQLDPNRNSKT